jgi:hypothetical protein
MTLVATMAWAFSTYNYNHYFDQSHIWDRVLLVALAIGCWFHPAFIFGFLLQMMAIASQFHHPLGDYSWTDKILPVRVLTAFAASLVTLLIWKRRVARDFILLACCIAAAHYFVAGWSKVELQWWQHDQLDNLAAGAQANGWFYFLSRETLARFFEIIRACNHTGVWLTLLVEVGAVVFLLHRRVAFGMLAGWILLHLGIFAASGICFWKWIIFDAALMVLLLQLSAGTKRWLFSTPRFATAVVLIAWGNSLFTPPRLGWHDTSVSYTFEFSGRGISGEEYEISKESLAPYDLFFSQNLLFFLTDRPALTATFGATRNSAVAASLRPPPRDTQEIAEIESRLGQSKYDVTQSALFVQFVERFFGTWNLRLNLKNQTVLRAPLHIWSHQPPNAYDGQEPLNSVRIHLTTWLYDPQRGLKAVSRELIREIAVQVPGHPPEEPPVDSEYAEHPRMAGGDSSDRR